jgi:hypothetical protein
MGLVARAEIGDQLCEADGCASELGSVVNEENGYPLAESRHDAFVDRLDLLGILDRVEAFLRLGARSGAHTSASFRVVEQGCDRIG